MVVEGQLSSLSLSFLNYKVGIIMGYRDVTITIDIVKKKCSVNSIVLILKGWFLVQHPLGTYWK